MTTTTYRIKNSELQKVLSKYPEDADVCFRKVSQYGKDGRGILSFVEISEKLSGDDLGQLHLVVSDDAST